MPTEYWNLWVSDAASAGAYFARGRLDTTDTLLIHAAPEKLTVEVHDSNRVLARGESLARTNDTPMARLRRAGSEITREDIWPTSADHDRPVLLPGGEVGRLTAWWHAPDLSEWRWSIELYNHR